MKALLVISLVLGTAFLSGHLSGGTISYVPIPAANSDAGSGISDKNSYLSAVNFNPGGDANLVVNGVTFHSLPGEGQTATSNGITLGVATGTLANAGGTNATIQADGVLGSLLSNRVSNNDAENGSEQYLTIDTQDLQPGTTYDFRIYVANAAGQNRQVNLAFVGDGNPPVETDFFNEDDATTSAGGFADPNQVYYINYRFQWDGQTTPGVTITQTDGGTPFCLYAVTNQVVPADGSAPPTPAISEVAPAATEPPAAPPPEAETASDDVGVTSEVFYNDPGLKKRGRWVNVGGQGTAWEPTGVPASWTPYTDGSWAYSNNVGWTWTTDEEWGWATYHYGRWARAGRRWYWLPGRVWAPAWVSWRYGGSYVGWAPLPPDAGFRRSIGISRWADRVYDIGPLNYSFVRVRDFGSVNISRVVINQIQNVNIITKTINITNIVNNNTVIYNGGPNQVVVNRIIQNTGGKLVPTIKLNRDSAVTLPGGKHTQLRDGVLSITSPIVKPVKNLTPPVKPTKTIDRTKLDHGWNLKDPKLANELKNHISSEAKGQTPENAPAQIPKNLTTDKTKPPVSPTPGPQSTRSVTPPGQLSTASPGITKPGTTPGQSPTLAPTASPKIIKPGTTPGQSPTVVPTASPEITKPGATPGQSPTLAPTASPRIIKPGTTLAPSPTVGQTPGLGITKPGATPGRSPTLAPTLTPRIIKPGTTPTVAPTLGPAITRPVVTPPRPSPAVVQTPSPAITKPVPTPRTSPPVVQTPVPVVTKSPVMTKPEATSGQTPLTVKKPVATPGPDKRVQPSVTPPPASTIRPKATATPAKNVRTTQTPVPTQIPKPTVAPATKHVEPPKAAVEKTAPVVKVPPKPAPVVQTPKPAPVIPTPPKSAPVVRTPPPKPTPVIPPPVVPAPAAKPKPTPTSTPAR